MAHAARTGEERRRAVALAQHPRENEGLSIAEIANRLRRSPATVNGYFSRPPATRPTRSNAATRRVSIAAHPTSARNGKGDAYHKTCHPDAIQAKQTRTRARRDAGLATARRHPTILV